MGAAIFVGLVLIATIVIVTIIGYTIYGMFLGLARLARLCKRLWDGFAGNDAETAPAAADSEAQCARQTPSQGEHCWNVKQCSVSAREHCPAYHRPEVPCWQAWMELNENAPLKPDCLTCKLFNLTSLVA